MRRAGFVVAALAALAGCTLLTKLDGLSGGAEATTRDGGGAEGGPEGGPQPDGGGDAAEAGPSRSARYAAAVLADKPLGYWRLDETTGTTAKDETGRHDGAYVMGPALGQPGVAGSGAMRLPRGLKAHVRVAAPDYRFAGKLPYSVEAWVQPGDLKDYQWVASTEIPEVGNNRSGWSVLGDASGQIRYEVWAPYQDGGAGGAIRSVRVSSTTIGVGAMHHVVSTFNGTTFVGYLDGVKGTTQNLANNVPNVGELYFGCRSDGNNCLDDWTLDELAIYPAALPADRVTAHYELGK